MNDNETPTSQFENTEEDFGYDLFGFEPEVDGGIDDISDYLVSPVKMPLATELKVSTETYEALTNAYKLLTLELADQAFDTAQATDEANLRRRAYRQGMQSAVLTILKRITH